VTEDDRVVGLVGLRQVNRLRRDKWPETRVGDVMVKPPRLPLLSADDPLPTAVAGLQRANVDGLPVLADGRLVGLVTRPGVGKVVAERMPKVGSGRKL
jgi:CBS domain-containing protein